MTFEEHQHGCGCAECQAFAVNEHDCNDHDETAFTGSTTGTSTGAAAAEDYWAILRSPDGGNSRWNGGYDYGTSVVITYSFLETNELPVLTGTGSYGTTGYATFTEQQRAYVRDVMTKAEEAGGIKFVEVDGPSMIDWYSAVGATGVSGYAGYAYSTETYTGESDVRMVYQNFTPGTFAHTILFHELGHALGLEHSHQGTYTLSSTQDKLSNTVMTYNYTNPYPKQYQPMDVQALTHLYGDAAGTAGWTVEVLSSGLIDIRLGGGNDEMIGTDRAAQIWGGAGDDVIFGRQADDRLFGQNDNDSIEGGSGKDFVHGGSGDDILIGDTGLANVGGNDTMVGGKGNDTLYGNGGDDWMKGNLGNDSLYGQDGDDRLFGGDHFDVLVGGRGNDYLEGGAGVDHFVLSREDIGNRERIAEFETGKDVLDLQGLNTDASATLITFSGTHTVVTLESFNIQIVMLRTTPSQFTMEDILF